MFSVSALFIADFATRRLGARWGLFIGGSSVAFFMLCEGSHLVGALAGYDLSWLVLLGAATNGLGNAVLWVAQYWVIVLCSTMETRGRFWAIFWILLSVSKCSSTEEIALIEILI